MVDRPQFAGGCCRAMTGFCDRLAQRCGHLPARVLSYVQQLSKVLDCGSQVVDAAEASGDLGWRAQVG